MKEMDGEMIGPHKAEVDIATCPVANHVHKSASILRKAECRQLQLPCSLCSLLGVHHLVFAVVVLPLHTITPGSLHPRYKVHSSYALNNVITNP